MDATCIPFSGAVNFHRTTSKHNASAEEMGFLIAAVRGLPADSRLPEATLLDIVKRHAEHRMAVKHGGNQRQAVLKCDSIFTPYVPSMPTRGGEAAVTIGCTQSCPCCWRDGCDIRAESLLCPLQQ